MFSLEGSSAASGPFYLWINWDGNERGQCVFRAAVGSEGSRVDLAPLTNNFQNFNLDKDFLYTTYDTGTHFKSYKTFYKT